MKGLFHVKHFALTLALALSCAAAQAQWVLVVADADDVPTYMDTPVSDGRAVGTLVQRPEVGTTRWHRYFTSVTRQECRQGFGVLANRTFKGAPLDGAEFVLNERVTVADFMAAHLCQHITTAKGKQ